MPRIHVIDSGETAQGITASKLQSSLAESPDCVLVPGCTEALYGRYEELGMYTCRGSGSGFQGPSATFLDFIRVGDVMVGGLQLVRLGRGNSFRFSCNIQHKDIEAAVNKSRLASPTPPRDSCQLMLTTMPLETATILQDLKVLPQLRKFYIQVKGEPILLNKNWMLGRAIMYATLQELLQELKTLPDTYDEDSLVRRMQDMYMHYSMKEAKRIRTLIPGIVRKTYRTVNGLIAQLSPCVQECLRAGLPIQTIEDALDSKLQEPNYACARKDC